MHRFQDELDHLYFDPRTAFPCGAASAASGSPLLRSDHLELGSTLVKEMPKKIWRQEIFPDEARQLFETARDKALTMIKPVTLPDDGRRGLGVVYATEPKGQIGLILGQWRWRRVTARHCSAALGAGRFMDDPMGAAPIETLARRMAVASAFADAMNSLTEQENVRFVARPLEVVLASVEQPEGFYPGEKADVLAVDLMAGLSVPQVIRRMIREEHGDDPDYALHLYATWGLHTDLWHRLARLNDVRAMFNPQLRRIAVPDVHTVRRHLIELQKTIDGR